MTTTAPARPDVAELLRRAGDLVRRELEPLEPTLLQRGFRAVLPQLQAARRRARELGLWTPHLPPEHGGLGLSLAEFAPLSEALGRSPLGLYACNCQAPDVGNMEILLAHGTDEQRERFLAPLLRGEVRSCFAMTEPEHAGSNPVWMSTTAVEEGDDFVLNGHKWFASSADGAAFAVVMAITDPEHENPYRRASQILVPTDAPGFRRVRNIPVMGDVGEDYFSHAEILLEDCRVPKANLLGARGEGFAIAQERLGPGRIHHCMRWIGICERAFEMTCERAASRQLAPGKPLASRQVIQHWIAESRARIHASRLMVLDAARRIDRRGSRAARLEISMIKFFVADTLTQVLDRAIQVHGALGLTDDTLLSFWSRHERAAHVYDGADEVHKTVVARMALKPYGVDVRL
ncbi:MAG: acyl-CoA dehydrogenase [Acidobacteria bacterium]|nr:MAG: acyl-CoA dehydrogenase [Acidobacteriota bacterium]